MTALRATYPYDHEFYARLWATRPTFELVSSHLVPRGTGYGFAVEAGQTFRFIVVEGPQIIDLDLFSSADPSEHFASGAQFNIEGGIVTRLTRIWGTPPRSRPLATCVADTVRPVDNRLGLRDHKSYGAHCNPHHWLLMAGTHPRTCYDNLRAACAMVGLSQRFIHDNLNLFQKSGLDAHTGKHLIERSDAEPGDELEFYAEIPLLVALSLCPHGDGADPLPGRERDIPVYPLLIEVYETGIEPLPWPYAAA